MNDITQPRYETAGNTLPGDRIFWDVLLNQSDIFAYNTANEGKGGPFGAQLWLVNLDTERRILVGTAAHFEDSNAVVSKGLASAHAEAENLSPENREALKGFLKENRAEHWHVVQVSSGESCPSCRAKQVTLMNELVQEGLLAEKDFYVIFKATYQQTQRDANFNDAPYDQTFRAVAALDLLDGENGLFDLEKTLQENAKTAQQIAAGELVYNPVNKVSAVGISSAVKSIFEQAGDQPVAVIVTQKGKILSFGLDERETHNSINMPEETAIVSALHKAAGKLREEEGKFEAWNLEGAQLYTNVSDIGPVAYSESLWYNLSGIVVVDDYSSDLIDEMAQEVPGIGNRDLFKQVAADYDSGLSPLNVVFGGDPEEASVAHLLWKAKMAMEGLKNKQAERIDVLHQRNGQSPIQIEFIDGTGGVLSDYIQTSAQSSHYNGKEARVQNPSGP